MQRGGSGPDDAAGVDAARDPEREQRLQDLLDDYQFNRWNAENIENIIDSECLWQQTSRGEFGAFEEFKKEVMRMERPAPSMETQDQRTARLSAYIAAAFKIDNAKFFKDVEIFGSPPSQRVIEALGSATLTLGDCGTRSPYAILGHCAAQVTGNRRMGYPKIHAVAVRLRKLATNVAEVTRWQA